MPFPPVIPPSNRANGTPQEDAHPSDHNAISQALTDIVTQVNPTPWTALPFAVGWSNSVGQQVCQYRKVGDVVELRGCAAVDNPTAHPQICVLPAGFRAPAQAIFATWTIYTGGIMRVDAASDGSLSIGGGIGTAAIGYTSLTGIRFSVLP